MCWRPIVELCVLRSLLSRSSERGTVVVVVPVGREPPGSTDHRPRWRPIQTSRLSNCCSAFAHCNCSAGRIRFTNGIVPAGRPSALLLCNWWFYEYRFLFYFYFFIRNTYIPPARRNNIVDGYFTCATLCDTKSHGTLPDNETRHIDCGDADIAVALEKFHEIEC